MLSLGSQREPRSSRESGRSVCVGNIVFPLVRLSSKRTNSRAETNIRCSDICREAASWSVLLRLRFLGLSFWLLFPLQAFSCHEMNSSNHSGTVAQRYTIFTLLLLLFCCFLSDTALVGSKHPQTRGLEISMLWSEMQGRGQLHF